MNKYRSNKPKSTLFDHKVKRIWDDFHGINFEMNDWDTMSKDVINITTTTNINEETTQKQLELQRHPRLELLLYDIQDIKNNINAFINRRYKEVTPNNYRIKEKHLKNVKEIQCFNNNHEHSDCIWVAKFSYDGKYLATGSKSGTLKIWEILSLSESIDSYQSNELDSFFNLFNEKEYRTYKEHKCDIIDIAWSEKNKHNLVSVSIDHTAILWDINELKSIQVYKHNAIVSCVSFYPAEISVNIAGIVNQSDVFITGCFDKIVRIWGTRSLKPVAYINVTELITAISFFPEGNFIAMGNTNGNIAIYECTVNL